MGGPNLIFQWCRRVLIAVFALFDLMGTVTTKWLKASILTCMYDLLWEGGLIGPLVSIEMR